MEGLLPKRLNSDAKRVALDELLWAEELKPAGNDVGEPFSFSVNRSPVSPYSLARPRNPPLRLKLPRLKDMS
jgi:hypothetical protein